MSWHFMSLASSLMRLDMVSLERGICLSALAIFSPCIAVVIAIAAGRMRLSAIVWLLCFCYKVGLYDAAKALVGKVACPCSTASFRRKNVVGFWASSGCRLSRCRFILTSLKLSFARTLLQITHRGWSSSFLTWHVNPYFRNSFW